MVQKLGFAKVSQTQNYISTGFFDSWYKVALSMPINKVAGYRLAARALFQAKAGVLSTYQQKRNKQHPFTRSIHTQSKEE
jgi:hypothetical protein